MNLGWVARHSGLHCCIPTQMQGKYGMSPCVDGKCRPRIMAIYIDFPSLLARRLGCGSWLVSWDDVKPFLPCRGTVRRAIHIDRCSGADGHDSYAQCIGNRRAHQCLHDSYHSGMVFSRRHRCTRSQSGSTGWWCIQRYQWYGHETFDESSVIVFIVLQAITGECSAHTTGRTTLSWASCILEIQPQVP